MTPEQLADIAIGTPLPKGFGEHVDGTDGERTGTNVARWADWKLFFHALLNRTIGH